MKLRPIQEELHSTCLKLEELQSTKETNEKNKNFLYLSAKDIMQELKSPIEKHRQLQFFQKESMNALSTWLKAFNELKRRYFV